MLIVVAMMPFSLIMEELVVPGIALITLIAYLSIRGLVYAFRGIPAPAVERAVAEVSAEEYAVARHSDLLANFTTQEADAILGLALRAFLPEGVVIGDAGTEGTTLYMILDGSVELTGHTEKSEMGAKFCLRFDQPMERRDETVSLPGGRLDVSGATPSAP